MILPGSPAYALYQSVQVAFVRMDRAQSPYLGEPGKMTVWKPGLWGGCGREKSVAGVAGVKAAFFSQSLALIPCQSHPSFHYAIVPSLLFEALHWIRFLAIPEEAGTLFVERFRHGLPYLSCFDTPELSLGGFQAPLSSCRGPTGCS